MLHGLIAVGILSYMFLFWLLKSKEDFLDVREVPKTDGAFLREADFIDMNQDQEVITYNDGMRKLVIQKGSAHENQ